MAKLVRCKVCGYVMPEGRLKDKCPACGVAAKAFEPWEDPLSEERRRALALDLHPIAVHFPTAFAVSLIVIFVVGLAFTRQGRGAVPVRRPALDLFLPLVVIVSFLLGVKDGIVRFRSVGRSEILKKKVLFGLLYFAFALAPAPGGVAVGGGRSRAARGGAGAVGGGAGLQRGAEPAGHRRARTPPCPGSKPGPPPVCRPLNPRS